MNNMIKVKHYSEKELKQGIETNASWHQDVHFLKKKKKQNFKKV